MHCFLLDGYRYNGWGGTIMMVLFWVLLIVAIVWLVRNIEFNHKNNKNNINENQAEKIARQRFAQGEINKEEFEKILKNLRE